MSKESIQTTGKIKPIKLKNDPFLNADFSVSVSTRFTVITIGKRSFYFNPDGTFDGTGTDLLEELGLGNYR